MAVDGQPAAAGLPCGRKAADVWEHAETGTLDPHERGCSHCQAVAADAQILATAAAELAAEIIEPPSSLLDRVMGAVRAEVRHDYLPLPTQHGPARLERHGAAAVLRHAIDQMPGVRARSCRISIPTADEQPNGEPAGNDEPPPPAAVVEVSVAMALTSDMHTIAARVQQVVLTAADRLLGLPTDRIDVDVVDVFYPAPADSGPEEATG
jgi:hypothetical protein